jgi:hypothetical protein
VGSVAVALGTETGAPGHPYAREVVVVTFVEHDDEQVTCRVRDVRTQRQWTVSHAAELRRLLLEGRPA